MPEVVIRSGNTQAQEAEMEAKRQRWADIKAHFAAGNLEAGYAALQAYQDERAEYYRNLESEQVR